MWDHVGPIEPGESVTLSVDVSVDDDSRAGFFHDDADVRRAECDGIPLEGQDTLDLPEVRVPTAAAPPALPRTGGGALAALVGLSLVGGATPPQPPAQLSQAAPPNARRRSLVRGSG